MNSRERVLAAIQGAPVDRVPLMLWLNPHTTCRLLAEIQPGKNAIASKLGKAIWKRFIRRGRMEADALSRILPLIMEEYGNGEYALELGSDIAILSPEFISPSSFIGSIRFRNGGVSVRGAFGGRMALSGIYMHPSEPAVQNPQDLKHLRLPKVTARHFSNVRSFRKKYPHACLLVEIGAMQQVLCDYLLGSQAFMLGLYDFPEEIHAFMRRMGDWLENIIHLAAKAGTDVIFLQDDYGCNNRPLFSMKMWEEITFPQLCRLVKAAHAHQLPFMLHSCGYQMPFLDYYMRAGVDILQSLQTGAGNDLEEAIRISGGKLAFATGIDVQKAASQTPGDLRDSIQKAYEAGKRSGKFILGMTHMLQHDLSTQKLQLIFDQVRKLQKNFHRFAGSDQRAGLPA